MIYIEIQEAERRDHNQWQELEYCGYELHDARIPDSGRVHPTEQPNAPDRNESRQCTAICQCRPKDREIADERNSDRGITRPDRYPISPRNQESGKISEPATSVGVRPPGLGHHPTQTGKHESQQHRACRRDQPPDYADSTVCSQRGRQEEHTGSHHVTHYECRAHPQAECPPASRR